MARARYQIQLRDDTFSLETDGHLVYENGEPISLSVMALGAGRYSVILDGRSINVTVQDQGPDWLTLRSGGTKQEISWMDRRALLLSSLGLTDGQDQGHSDIMSPMPGMVRKVLVSPGQTVHPGDGLLILEAMKMENELRAPSAGVVTRIHAVAGDSVMKNQLLIEIES